MGVQNIFTLFPKKQNEKKKKKKKRKEKKTNYLRCPIKHTDDCNYDTGGDDNHDFDLSNT